MSLRVFESCDSFLVLEEEVDGVDEGEEEADDEVDEGEDKSGIGDLDFEFSILLASFSTSFFHSSIFFFASSLISLLTYL